MRINPFSLHFPAHFLIKSRVFSFGQMNKIQAYKILGVNDLSNHEEIKKAYLKLSKKYHPDLNPAPSASEEFKQINEAYTILKNILRSFEEGGQSFTVQKAKYNKYDGKISKEDFGIFQKYMDEKKINKEAGNQNTIDQMEKEWHKNHEQIFYEIFGKNYHEASDILFDEKNQNLREIYEEEIEKLFKKKFADKLDSIEKTIKNKINDIGAKFPPKSRDRVKIREQINKFLKK